MLTPEEEAELQMIQERQRLRSQTVADTTTDEEKEDARRQTGIGGDSFYGSALGSLWTGLGSAGNSMFNVAPRQGAAYLSGDTGKLDALKQEQLGNQQSDAMNENPWTMAAGRAIPEIAASILPGVAGESLAAKGIAAIGMGEKPLLAATAGAGVSGGSVAAVTPLTPGEDYYKNILESTGMGMIVPPALAGLAGTGKLLGKAAKYAASPVQSATKSTLERMYGKLNDQQLENLALKSKQFHDAGLPVTPGQLLDDPATRVETLAKEAGIQNEQFNVGDTQANEALVNQSLKNSIQNLQKNLETVDSMGLGAKGMDAAREHAATTSAIINKRVNAAYDQVKAIPVPPEVTKALQTDHVLTSAMKSLTDSPALADDIKGFRAEAIKNEDPNIQKMRNSLANYKDAYETAKFKVDSYDNDPQALQYPQKEQNAMPGYRTAVKKFEDMQKQVAESDGRQSLIELEYARRRLSQMADESTLPGEATALIKKANQLDDYLTKNHPEIVKARNAYVSGLNARQLVNASPMAKLATQEGEAAYKTVMSIPKKDTSVFNYTMRAINRHDPELGKAIMGQHIKETLLKGANSNTDWIGKTVKMFTDDDMMAKFRFAVKDQPTITGMINKLEEFGKTYRNMSPGGSVKASHPMEGILQRAADSTWIVGGVSRYFADKVSRGLSDIISNPAKWVPAFKNMAASKQPLTKSETMRILHIIMNYGTVPGAIGVIQ